MINSNKPFLIFFLCSLGFSVANAQFTKQAALDKTADAGFYKVGLGPDVMVAAAEDLRDIRIIDDKGRQVPFIVRPSETVNITGEFLSFPILSNGPDTAGNSVVIVDNAVRASINYLDLSIKNTAVKRTLDISGSDDLNNWYAIQQNTAMEPGVGAASDKYVQLLRFPLSNYRYIKLLIANDRKDPVNITKAGISRNRITSVPDYMNRNPQPHFRQKDSADGNTYILIDQEKTYPVSEVLLKLSGRKFFEREVSIFSRPDSTGVWTLLTASVLSSRSLTASDTLLEVPVPNSKFPHLLLRLSNGDNPPLKLTALILQHRRQNLIAWLEKEQEYKLVFGDSSALSPVYDLRSFEDSIPSQISSLNYRRIVDKTNVEPSAATASSRKWLWPVIIACVALLAILSVRLLGDMKNKGI
jgi:hypothetical protein